MQILGRNERNGSAQDKTSDSISCNLVPVSNPIMKNIVTVQRALMKMKRQNADELPSSITDLDIDKCERNLLVPVLPQVVFGFSICDCGT